MYILFPSSSGKKRNIFEMPSRPL